MAKLKKLLQTRNPKAAAAAKKALHDAPIPIAMRMSMSGHSTGIPSRNMRQSLNGGRPHHSLREDLDLIECARHYFLLCTRGQQEVRPVDAIYSPEMVMFLKSYDKPLKRSFAWYAALEETDPNRVTWEYVKARDGTVSRSSIILFLLNFQVQQLDARAAFAIELCFDVMHACMLLRCQHASLSLSHRPCRP